MRVIGLLLQILGYVQIVGAWMVLRSGNKEDAFFGFWSGPFFLLVGWAMRSESLRSGWRTYTGIVLAYFGVAAVSLGITDHVWGTPEEETWAYFVAPLLLLSPAGYLLWRGYVH
jgi:hypothetical protein